MSWQERDEGWVNDLTLLYDNLYYLRTTQSDLCAQQGISIAMAELAETFPWLIKEWMERVRTK